MPALIEVDKQIAMDYFGSRGWEIRPVSQTEAVRCSIVKGSPICCADDRHPEDLPPAPAFPGGTDGIASLIDGDIHTRHRKAADRIVRSGHLPGSHGDRHKGTLRGCRFREAWINGEIPGLPPVNLLDVGTAVFTHSRRDSGQHLIYSTTHAANALLLNFEPDTTVLPNGSFLRVDLWYPVVRLNFPRARVLQLTVQVGELILPPQQRRLLVV